MSKVFKVCRIIEGRYYSYNLSPNEITKIKYYRELNKSIIEYEIGKVIYPKYGKLFAFDTLKNACGFIGMTPDSLKKSTEVCIFSCEAETSDINLKGVPRFSKSYPNFWDNLDADTFVDSENLMYIPHGTVLCESIKLIERCQ